MNRVAKGFTLVELMIVVGIIAILAAVAMPAYQNYTIRAKMSEVILAMSTCRVSITEVYQSAGSPPGVNGWGCEVTTAGTGASKYVKSISTDGDGKVTAVIQNIGNQVDGSSVTMIPLVAAGTPAVVTLHIGAGLFGWSCGGIGSTVDPKFLPGSCRGL